MHVFFAKYIPYQTPMATSDHFHSTLFLPQICPLTHTILCLLFTERSCGHPPIVSHAQIRRIHGFSVGSIIEYQCVTGYAMRDSDFITCQPGGSWSVSPVCLGVLRFTSWCHRGIFMLQIGTLLLREPCRCQSRTLGFCANQS